MKITLTIDCESTQELKEVASVLAASKLTVSKQSVVASNEDEADASEEMEDVESPYKDEAKAPAKKGKASTKKKVEQTQEATPVTEAPQVDRMALVQQMKSLVDAFGADPNISNDVKRATIEKIKANIGAPAGVSPLDYDVPMINNFIQGVNVEWDALKNTTSSAGALI